MKLLLLGADGQVGWHLRKALAPLGALTAAGRGSIDFTDSDTLREIIRTEQPDIIVNAAAYTKVDKAEEDKRNAWQVNSEAPAIIAETAATLQSLLVHFSTVYVFDGNKPEPYTEADLTNPLSIYGQSKAEGEERVQASGCRGIILRTGWVYSMRGHGFAQKILERAAASKEIQVVSDQIGAPTSAEMLAHSTSQILQRLIGRSEELAPRGEIFHLNALGTTSWHALAVRLVTAALNNGFPLQARPDTVRAITTEHSTFAAKRPLNCVLDCTKVQTTFGLSLPPWQDEYELFEKQVSMIAS